VNGLGGVQHPPFAESFTLLRSSPFWKEMAPTFRRPYLGLLMILEVLLHGRYVDIIARSSPQPTASLRDVLWPPDTH